MRCTQNPTMGEEWRRGWHPERIAVETSEEAHVLVVGGGPAGLECALALGRRGYEVTLAEASAQAWAAGCWRNRACRASAPGSGCATTANTCSSKLANVAVYRESQMTAEDIVGFGADHVVLATGSAWREDGIGAMGETPMDSPPMRRS